ncbi:hypothetical protein STSP_70370 [Streptomyces jeddahensis]|uniref:Uncharacterized protein n=1 Tax=Streptomyces jeddahensis TaxID=1716141 RepID=A0A177HF66_9ACTN|nr:hypothetical protein STSP_70370 [Streptomyces jeddahensis]
MDTEPTPAAVAVMWNCRAWSKEDACGSTSTPNHADAHSLGSKSGNALTAGPWREIAGFAVSQDHCASTPVAGASPVLHTRAPMWNRFGPLAGLLESRPTTFHSSGVMLSAGAAA